MLGHLEIQRPVITLRPDGYEVVVNGTLLTTPRQNTLILPTAELAEAIAKEWEIFLFESLVRNQRHQSRGKAAFSSSGAGPMAGVQQNDHSFVTRVETYSYQTLPPLTHLAALTLDSTSEDLNTLNAQLLNLHEADSLRAARQSPLPPEAATLIQSLIKAYDEGYGKELRTHLQMWSPWVTICMHKLSLVSGSLILPLALGSQAVTPAVAFNLIEAMGWAKQSSSLSVMTVAQRRLVIRTQLIVCSRFLTLLDGAEMTASLTQPRISEAVFSKLLRA